MIGLKPRIGSIALSLKKYQHVIANRIQRLFDGFSPQATALSALSGLLMALSFAPYDMWFFVWVGLIPLLYALEDRSLKGTYWLSVLSGANMVWFGYTWLPLTVETFWHLPLPIGYLFLGAFGFFAGQALGLVAVLARWIVAQTPWMPRGLVWSIVCVSVWSVFPMVLHFTFGNALHTVPVTLQGISLLGGESADFTIVLTNYGLYAFVRRRRLSEPRSHTLITWAWICLWFGYGLISFQQWTDTVDGWDTIKVGLLQTHRESTSKRLPPEPGYSRTYPVEIAMSERLAQKGAEVIVFPEGHKFGYFKELHVRRALHRAARRMETDILLHDKGWGHLLDGTNIPQKRNSTILLRRNGEFGGIYHKRKLVPFGEYYPLIGDHPEWIERLGLFKPMVAGETPVLFEAGGMHIQALICYETIFGQFVAESMSYDGTGKVLAVQTNDGWYGGGAQTAQHRSFSVLRAIENRVSLIQAINDGQSHVVTPDGRYLFVGDEWTRAEYVVDLPYDPASGGTLYTRMPYLFLSVIWVIFLALILHVIRHRLRTRAADTH